MVSAAIVNNQVTVLTPLITPDNEQWLQNLREGKAFIDIANTSAVTGFLSFDLCPSL